MAVTVARFRCVVHMRRQCALLMFQHFFLSANRLRQLHIIADQVKHAFALSDN